ncbi:MAG TPA: hypothetical protein VMY34_01780 [Acidimicrobiales bacterium]|nr:hypothetical protein [Acidimicrobiales bacterium]
MPEGLLCDRMERYFFTDLFADLTTSPSNLWRSMAGTGLLCRAGAPRHKLAG